MISNCIASIQIQSMAPVAYMSSWIQEIYVQALFSVYKLDLLLLWAGGGIDLLLGCRIFAHTWSPELPSVKNVPRYAVSDTQP